MPVRESCFLPASPVPARLLSLATSCAGGRALALVAVLAVHAGLLAAALMSLPAPAAALSPPAVVGVLVSGHSEPRLSPLAPPSTRPEVRPAPARALAPGLAPSERAPDLPGEALPPTPATDTAPAPASEPVASAASQSPAPAAAYSGASPTVTPPRSDAAHLDNPRPVYPAVSRRLKEQGTVVLEVFILADGSVGDLRVKRSSGFPRLDEAALAAVRRWTYVPARRGSEPLALWHSQSLVFSLVR